MNPPPPSVLIVDDSKMERKLLNEALRQSGYQTLEASDGSEALDILERQDSQTLQAILLDKHMPGMDGFEVLHKIKQSPRFKHLPVIMQTGVTDRASILEGLKLGAYHYLTKPFDIKILKGVISTAIENVRLYNGLQTDLENQVASVKLLREGTFVFKTPNDALCLSTHLAAACPKPQKTVLGLAELLTNAIEHGNLALNYADKSRLIDEKQLDEEIDRRLQDPQYRGKTALVTFRKQSDKITFIIEDQGAGFNWQQFCEFDLQRLHDRHGRGIAIAKSLSFDDVSFVAPGNKVIATINISNK